MKELKKRALRYQASQAQKTGTVLATGHRRTARTATTRLGRPGARTQRSRGDLGRTGSALPTCRQVHTQPAQTAAEVEADDGPTRVL